MGLEMPGTVDHHCTSGRTVGVFPLPPNKWNTRQYLTTVWVPAFCNLSVCFSRIIVIVQNENFEIKESDSRRRQGTAGNLKPLELKCDIFAIRCVI